MNRKADVTVKQEKVRSLSALKPSTKRKRDDSREQKKIDGNGPKRVKTNSEERHAIRRKTLQQCMEGPRPPATLQTAEAVNLEDHNSRIN